MSPGARESIGTRGRAAVERACSSAIVAAETVDAFREAIAAEATGAGR
jgi:hypothetical protein